MKSHITVKTIYNDRRISKAITLITNSTFFTFNKKIYKQIFGTSMGCPLSPILADMMLQDIKKAALDRLPASLPFYYRYVDDILLASSTEWLCIISETFNSFHEKLKFTMEIGSDGRMSLDVTLIVENEIITFDLYKKSTNSGRYLNFHSNHPLVQ